MFQEKGREAVRNGSQAKVLIPQSSIIKQLHEFVTLAALLSGLVQGGGPIIHRLGFYTVVRKAYRFSSDMV